MPLPKPKLLAGWRRAKLIALINESYLSFRGCGTCGVVVNALALSTNPQAVSRCALDDFLDASSKLTQLRAAAMY
jgi:hypothetical protein